MKRFQLTIFGILLATAALAQTHDFEKVPVVQWRFKTKGPVLASPVISDNVAFFGGLDSTLYAVETLTGKLKWSLKTNGEIRTNVLVHNDKLYLVGGNGVMSCIDKSTGKVLWRTLFDNTAVYLAERRYDFADYYFSSPVLSDGVIYFGSGSGRIHALKADSGESLWTYRAADIVHTTPVIAKGKLIFGCFDGNVYALDLKSGQLAWKFKSVGHKFFPLGEMQGSPTVAEGSVILGSRDFNVYAIDVDKGYCNWNRRFEGGWALSNTAKDTVVYVGTSDDRILAALDARNGRMIWKTNVSFNIFGDCSFTETLVYVGTIWGKMYAIEAKTGKVRWSFSTDGHQRYHDQYFKQDDSFRDDIARILRSPAQWIAAEYKMGGIFSKPEAAGNIMVVTTAEGVVYGLSKQ